MNPGKLVLVRHGLSTYNDQNRFTGWKDVPLNAQGIAEAEQAAPLLREMQFDIAFTSVLVRAQQTLDSLLAGIGQEGLPVERDLALNERHYGALQGLNKAETAEQHGAEQVHIWRRSFDVAPPEGESLEMTAERTIPYFTEEIVPDLVSGKNVLVSAHGNSLRSIVMHIDGISPEDIVSLEIPTGEPIHYSYEEGVISRAR